MLTKRTPPLALAIAGMIAALWAMSPARAAADPAADQISSFNAVLLDTMKAGPSLGVKGRFRKLEPTITRTFDLGKMVRFAVGAPWSGFTAAQQQQVTEAFGRLTTASWAHNFSTYSGESFKVDPNVQSRGPDKVVKAQLIRPNGSPVNLMYRMQQSGGTWKVIDVYFDSISQLVTRRSDFAGPVASGGAPGLISHLNTLVDQQMK
jgi:phospholipid transport system substrate-binding protein